MKSKYSILILFVSINILCTLIFLFYPIESINFNLVFTSNCLLFCLSTLILRIQQKGLNNKNPNAFIQSIMLGMLLKMFVCVIAVLIYVLISKSGINKNGLLLSMFLYLIYLAVEVSAISKINKQRKNA